MPKGWEDYLSLDEDEAPAQPLPQVVAHQQEKLTFMLAIDRLNLPTRLSYSKTPFTSFSPTNKFHMIETIDLSNFKDKVHKALFRVFQRTLSENFSVGLLRWDV